MKKGFSLVELMVVVAISSVLLLLVTNFLIFSIQRNNQITIENSVRNEANLLMDKIATDVRNSSCEVVNGNSISLYDVSDCGSPPYAVYAVDASNNLTRNSVVLNSTAVKIQYCSVCSCSSPTAGFVIASAPTGRSYTFTLSLRQSQNNPRSDFCGKAQLKETISPRNE